MSEGGLNSSAAGTMRPSSTSTRLVSLWPHWQVAKCAKLNGEWLARDHQTSYQAVTQEADDIGRPDVALLM